MPDGLSQWFALCFYLLFSLTPVILWADFRFFQSRFAKRMGWHFLESKADQIIQIDGNYRWSQVAVLWLYAFYAGAILMWFLVMLHWVGLFRDELHWQAPGASLNLLQWLLESGLIVFLILMFWVKAIPARFGYRKQLIQHFGRTKAGHEIASQHWRMVGMGLLFNWGLMHLYFLLFPDPLILENLPSLLVWNWF